MVDYQLDLGITLFAISIEQREFMEWCTNFLVRMVEKYGREVLAEIEAEYIMT